MNASRLAAARAAQIPDRSSDDGNLRQGAHSKPPLRLIQDHQFRVLFPYLHPTGRAVVVGQGSSQDFLSVTSYTCDQPTGNDQAVITPIYTPQLYDDYSLPIDGSPMGQELQNLDISPSNSAAIGVQGKSGRPLPFVSKLVPGLGIRPHPYGTYPYKDAPADSEYRATPPQGDNAPGTTYQQPGATDRVVNKPKIDAYISDGLTWDAEDADGFTPFKLKLGRGLEFGDQDSTDDNRRPVQVKAGFGGGGGSVAARAGKGIAIDPPFPPLIATATVQTNPGNVDNGDHEYAAYYTTSTPNTSDLGGSVQVENADGKQQNIIAIAAYATPPAAINGLVLCRTKATGGDLTTFFQLHTFTRADIIAGISYTDNTADTGLGGAAAAGSPPVISVDLATDSSGTNISGMVETSGDDANGLAIDPYSPYAAAVVAGPGIAVTPPAPPAKPTVVIQAGAGLGIGAYEWAVTYQYTKAGQSIETNPSPVAAGTTTSGNQQALITALAPPALSGATITGTAVYRNAVGSPNLQRVTVVPGSGALSYTDTTPDGSLGVAAPHQKYNVQADLATQVIAGVSTNVSGIIDTAGDDGNGLQVNVDGTTLTINSSNQLVAAGGGSGLVITQVKNATGSIGFPGVVLTWGSIDFNNGAAMWASGSPTRMTAPSTGIYMVTFKIMAESTYPGSAHWAALFTEWHVNGIQTGPRSQWEAMNDGTATGGLWWGPSDVAYFQLTAGDYVEVLASMASGPAVPIPNYADTYLTMMKIA